jgi:phage head maturation protease
MRIFRKGWEIKAAGASLADNTITGAAAVCGNLDSYKDVIFPGAFDAALPDFLKNGFVAAGHEWDELPIAMPNLAEMRGAALYTEATFHGHQDAQDARTVASERLAAGLSVGLSVGFMCDWDGGRMDFESGPKLLEFAQNNGYDLSLFDVAGISAWDSWCMAILKIAKLVEYSIVAIPANPCALAMSAKSGKESEAIDFDALTTERDIERLLRDAGASKSQALGVVSRLKTSLREAATHEGKPGEPGEGGEPAPTDPAAPNLDIEAALKRRQIALKHLELRHVALTIGEK